MNQYTECNLWQQSVVKMSVKRKLMTITRGEKLNVLADLETNSRKFVALKYGISESTVSRIVSKKEELESQDGRNTAKRQRTAEHPELEECLYTWFTECREKNIPVSGPMWIKRKSSPNF